MGRMFCYLWWEKTNPNNSKFGERWVNDGKDPVKEIWKRIKNSVGVRKDLIKDGTVVLEHFWDVTDMAKVLCPDRLKKHGRVDDFIRPVIGYRKGTTGEVHELPAEEIVIKVNNYLRRVGQPLPSVGLSQNQADAVNNVLNSVANGKRTVVAELCARFGKTIWSGALVRETNANLTIVASYVLTSFSSFKKDLTSFEQFRDLVLVDSKDDDYQNQVNQGLSDNKQVVVFLSMCGGGRRQERIDYLFGLDQVRLVMIDEADFGVHKASQSKPLLEARSEDDVVILMTGTNGDKAASIWAVDHYLSVTYPELLMEKRLSKT